MSAKCFWCGAGLEWIHGKPRKEPCAECVELRAIVDRLPKTADGVLVVPTVDCVFDINGDATMQFVYAAFSWLTGHDKKEWCAKYSSGQYRLVSRCYSTREAAEAAVKEQT